MDIKQLQFTVVDALENVKAQDIRVFDTAHLTSLFDRIAIASGTSNRQTRALAASVRDSVRGAGGQVISVEGETTGEWVLVDLGDMVVHIMQPAIREYYRLEEIWGEREVKDVRPTVKKPSRRTASQPASDAAPEGEDKPKRTRRRPERAATGVEISQTTVEETAPAPRPRTPRVRKDAGKGLPKGTTVKVSATGSTRARPKKALTEGAPAERKTVTRAPSRTAPVRAKKNQRVLKRQARAGTRLS